MVDLDGTLAVLSVATWADGSEGRRICLQTIDAYVSDVDGTASDKFQALEQLQPLAASVLCGFDHCHWVLNAIDVRLSELMASMVGAGVSTVPSALLKR